MQARAYLLKPCPRNENGAPTGALVDGAEFAHPTPGIPRGIRVATRSGEDGDLEWARLVDEATTDQPDLKARSAPGAAIVVDLPESEQVLAFCFGSGRFLLRRSGYVLGFGMRAALNAAAASGQEAVASIGWVSYRTTDAAPIDGRLSPHPSLAVA